MSKSLLLHGENEILLFPNHFSVFKSYTNSFSMKIPNWKYLRVLWLAGILPVVIGVILLLAIWKGAFGPLPSFEELENPRSNLASEIISADGKTLGKYFYQNRSNVHFEDLSPNLVNALLATEDIRFHNHSGIDFRGLFRVFFRTLLLRQKNAGGGSTITQQLAKNLFPRTPNQGKLKTGITKLKEWITAVRLERNYTKEEIIAMYLNTVEFGSNAFGIKSASKTFFNKNPDALNIEEAAVLVGLLKAPTYYSPVRNPENSVARRNTVLAQVEKYGFLSEEQCDSISGLPLLLDYLPEDHNIGPAPYFRELLRGEMIKWCEENPKPDGSKYNLYRDGLKIYTTLDSRMQKHAEAAVEKHLSIVQEKFFNHWKGKKNAPFWELSEKEINQLMMQAVKRSERYRNEKNEGKNEKAILSVFRKPVPMRVFSWAGERDTVLSPWDSILYYKYFLQVGFMSMEPKTGHIKAWVGGINHAHFKYDHVKEGKRQVGSAFKPFVYALAMQEGWSPCMKLPNNPVTFENVDGQGTSWTPENAERDHDGKMMTLKEALAESANRITAFIMKQFGPAAVIEVVRKLGITSPIDTVPSICLGTADASVMEMVGAYSAFANQGVWIEPTYLIRIEDSKGNILKSFVPNKVEAMSEQTAYLMIKLLEGVVSHGTSASLRGSRYKLYQPMAGKTGTTQNHSDGWYMGITPELVSGAWVGNEDRSVHFRSMELGQGARLALPIWAFYMQGLYADKDLKIYQGDFYKPSIKITVETNCKNQKEVPQGTGNDFLMDGF